MGIFWAAPGILALLFFAASALDKLLKRRSDYDTRYQEYLRALAENRTPRSLP